MARLTDSRRQRIMRLPIGPRQLGLAGGLWIHSRARPRPPCPINAGDCERVTANDQTEIIISLNPV